MKRERSFDIAPSTGAALVALATLIAAVLRIHRLDTTLWIDEISPILAYHGEPASSIVFHYVSSNNHLLNTLLVRVATTLLGEQDWVVRLPACLFGILTVPALYAAARLALSRAASVAAAAILAVQYHHVFFSQNARGYAAHLLFGLLAAAFLVRTIEANRFGDKVGFVLASWLMTAAIPIGLFTLAAHGLILGLVLAMNQRDGRKPPLGSVIALCGSALLLSILTYAPVLPAMYSYIPETYTEPAVGFGMLSGRFLGEVLSGFGLEIGPRLIGAALLGSVSGCWAAYELWRRNWILTLALFLPLLLLATFAVATGYLVSPRYFVQGIAPAALCLAAAAEAVAERLSTLQRGVGPGRALMAGVIVISAVLQAPQLGRYYRLPKQPFRSAILRAGELAGAEGLVFAVDQTQNGFRYYGERLGLGAAQVRLIRTPDDFAAALDEAGGREVVAATTLERILRLRLPEVARELQTGWVVVESYDGTIGGGAISLWRRAAHRGPAEGTTEGTSGEKVD